MTPRSASRRRDDPVDVDGELAAELITEVCAAVAGVAGDARELVAAEVTRRAPLADDAARSRLVALAVARLTGLDVLEQHLLDPEVDEVMVNPDGTVWVDRGGALHGAGRLTPDTLEVVVERVLAPTGRRLDRTTPIVDVRLPGGSRLCAAVEPVAVGGGCVAIRRHRATTFPVAEFVDRPAVADLLSVLVAGRCNILVSGATSSGKTSLVAALLHHGAGHDRLVVCEDTAELPLDGLHTVRLEARPATADGLPGIELAALVRAALRLRPDRLVVGEFRGTEVLAAVEAMNTGHDGSLSTCHANGALDALRRVETLLMQAAPTWPLAAIRRQVTRSIDAVVHIARGADGARRVTEVVEVVEGDGEPDGRDLLGAGGRMPVTRLRAPMVWP
jgi:pilus assembly protein CpaF